MTDEPSDYTPADLEILLEKMGDIDDDATGFEVFGDIEWSGEYAPTPRRTLRAGREGGPMGKLNLDKVRAAKAAADAARTKLAATPPRAPSYSATGWQAQLRKLYAHGQGSAAATAAGLDPSARTVLRWFSGQQIPGAANRARIAAAYDWLAGAEHRAASDRSTRTLHALGDALNAALQERYKVPIRIFRPDHFDWY